MLSWKEIVQDYIIKHSTQIKKITQPLRDHFGVGYFTYHRIDAEGKYTVLVDRPDWAEHYVSEQIFLQDPYLRHPSVYQSGITLVESHGTDEYRDSVVKAGRKVLHMDLGVLLIHKEEHGVEFFGFSGNKATSCLQSLHVNRPQLLKSFAVHFKSKMGLVLKQMEGEASSLLELKGEDFLCKERIFPDIDLAICNAYYQDLGIVPEMAKKLSFRERQCLKLLIGAKSAKETALDLGLSKRTVESYLENIKDKFSCWSKQELLKIARNLEEMGLL